MVGVLASQVAALNDRISVIQSALSSNTVAEQALSASLDPRASQVVLSSRLVGSDVTARLVVDRRSGDAFWIGTSVPPLAAGRTHQPWSLVAGKAVSLGVLGPAPRYVALRVEANMSVFMVTNEPEGGTPAPTSPVLFQGSLSPA